MRIFNATSPLHLNDEANERRVVNWLGVIAVLSMAGVVALAMSASRSEFGIDTAVIVALIGITAQCASSLGTRRTRQTPGDSGSTQPEPTPLVINSAPAATGTSTPDGDPVAATPMTTIQRGDTTVTVPADTFTTQADDDYLGH